MSDDQIEPTHRIHWRVSCDARMIGRGFDIHRTHEARVRQAGYLYASGLMPERCHFGPRRLVLEGEVDYFPPKWAASRPSLYGHDLADQIARWTLKTLYGARPLATDPPLGGEPENMRIDVRVRRLALSPADTA